MADLDTTQNRWGEMSRLQEIWVDQGFREKSGMSGRYEGAVGFQIEWTEKG